jgi:nicastrin
MLYNITCPLFQELLPKKQDASTEPAATNLYVSVQGNGRRQVIVSIIQRLLARKMGELVKLPANATTDEGCLEHRKHDTNYEYFWMMGQDGMGECVKSVTYTTRAISPLFESGEVDPELWSSGNYSSWTESVWTTPEVRIFLKPSPSSGRWLMSLGCLMTAVAFFVVYHIDKNSKKWFASRSPSSRTSLDRAAIVTHENVYT